MIIAKRLALLADGYEAWDRFEYDLEGREAAIFAQRDRKLETAREKRRRRRQGARKEVEERTAQQACSLQTAAAY